MIKKITITNIFGNSFGAISSHFPNGDFPTIEAWKHFHIHNETWGKPERWVRAKDGVIPESYIDTREEYVDDSLGGGTYVTEYLLQAEYTITEEDVTAEHQAILKQQKRIAFENFGKEFKRWVQILNEDSGVTPAQVLAIRADPRMSMANDLAEGGDIPTLKHHIEQTDWTGLFPAPVVTQALAKIDAFLVGWS